MKSKRKKKYKINEYIDKLMSTVGSMAGFETIVQKYGITRATFHRDRGLVNTDVKSIPSDRLDIYAALFNVSSDELKNYKVNVKAIELKQKGNVEAPAS